MKFNYKNSNVNYEYYDNNSKISLVFLHGWGQNIQMMIPLAKPFIKKYNCMIIDLPGFGDSEEPQEVYTIYDYAEMVNKLLTSKKIKNPIPPKNPIPIIIIKILSMNPSLVTFKVYSTISPFSSVIINL